MTAYAIIDLDGFSIMELLIAERLSTRQVILHRISASVSIYIYMYVSRLGMQLYCVQRMAWPALLWFSSHVLYTRVLAEVESRTTTERRVGKGLGILLHYAKESNKQHTKPKLKDQRVRSHKTRGACTY